MDKERIRMTKIEVQVEPPRVTNGWPRSAGIVREGRLQMIAVDKWGYSDEIGKIPPGHEGMTRAEFEHFSASVLAAFDVYEAANAARGQLEAQGD